MFKIACFDLGYADEDYSIDNCKKYGGGGIVGRYFKQIDNFHLYAPKKSFENLHVNDRKENCFILDQKVLDYLKQGYPIDSLIPNINDYDIILHGHTHFSFNRNINFKKPIVHWAGFGGDCGHPANNYILLYRESFKPYYGEKHKYVKIGKDVPKNFVKNNDRDGIFQCTQHVEMFDTISIAKECIKYNIKAYFAGPIRDNYPLLDFIDNKHTFYLGLLPEEEKLNFTRKATLYTLPLIWDVAFNQSAIEANGLGTPILTRKVGWFNEYVKDGINGFFYDGNNFIDIYNNAKNIDQNNCWLAAKEYSIEEMIRTFYKSFEEIYREWYN